MEKKGKKIFGRINKKYYLCHRYPENNLFTLKETNTYWRFGAVACEGHRFFFALNFPPSLAQTSSAHPINYTFHTICKKRKYIILHSCHQGENTIALPTEKFFPGQAKISPWASKKKSWAASKKKIWLFLISVDTFLLYKLKR